MSDAAATPAKTPKKKSAGKAKKPSSHPKYSKMIKDALTALKERGGSSRQAILKYIMKHYNLGHDERLVNAHLKMALRAGVKNGTLKQAKGTGATGSFRVGDKKEKAEKKPKAKKPKAKKPKAAGAKKAAKKPKKAAGAAKAKKPKAAKKPAAAKVKKPKAAKPKKPKAAAKAKKAGKK